MNGPYRLVVKRSVCNICLMSNFRVARYTGTIAKAPLAVSFSKREKPPGTQPRAASVLLKSSPKKRIHFDDIPQYVRMSGQFCTKRDSNLHSYRTKRAW